MFTEIKKKDKYIPEFDHNSLLLLCKYVPHYMSLYKGTHECWRGRRTMTFANVVRERGTMTWNCELEKERANRGTHEQRNDDMKSQTRKGNLE